MNDRNDNTLPAGKTCRDCFHWYRCDAMGQTLATDTVCQYAPHSFVDASQVPKATIGDGDTMPKIVSDTPILDCSYQSPEDSCCQHPNNTTPECHIAACPRLVGPVAKLERENARMKADSARLDLLERSGNVAFWHGVWAESMGPDVAGNPIVAICEMDQDCDQAKEEVAQSCSLRGAIDALKASIDRKSKKGGSHA